MCNRLLGGMRKRDGDVLCAKFGSKFSGLTVEGKVRTSARLANHLNVTPCHAVVPAGAQGLHGSFLGGEAGSVAFHAIGL